MSSLNARVVTLLDDNDLPVAPRSFSDAISYGDIDVKQALDGLIASGSTPYSETSTYALGAYCNQLGVMYKCTTAITSPEAWNAGHWTATSVAVELAGKSNTGHTHDNRYYTESETDTKLSGKSDTNHNHAGMSINPSSIELNPSTSAGHGGYIDFHFNGDAADYTSRIYEPAKGVLKYNDHGILSTANIVALLNVNITFTNGVATYENSAIKSSSVTFVQWRAGAVSTLTDSVLSTTPQNGSMIIIAKNGLTRESLPVNILIINL